MADSVTNVEVEDVLSSIRRLVSDDAPCVSRKSIPVISEETPDEPGQDALVLTPALRVIPDDTDAEADSEAPLFLHQDRSVSVEEETNITADGDPFHLDAPIPSLTALEATIAELEAAVGGQINDWEPDGSEDEAVLDPPPTLLLSGALRNGPVDTPPGRLTFGIPADLPREEAARVNVEPAHVPLPDEIDDPVLDAKAETHPQLSDQIAADESPSEGSVNAALAETDDASDEVLLDEATLNELIVNMVHQELKGALGEQITRNIRKIIRQEIHKYFDVRENE